MIQSNGKRPQEDGSRPFELVLLAGALNPSPLRRELDVPVFCLPVTAESRMIDLWLALARQQPNCRGVRIAVSSSEDAHRAQQAIEPHLSAADAATKSSMPPVEVHVDPNEYRGPAGLIRDLGISAESPAETVMVVGEVSSLAPPTLEPLFAALKQEQDVAGLVGASEMNEPAGVYVFTKQALATIPAIGFQDIKEQLLPRLYGRDMNVRMACVIPRTKRIRDRDSYLSIVWHLHKPCGRTADSREQVVSGSAHVSAACLIQDNVTIEDGAIIHDSVVMEGATIGGGAVVSRSVVSPHGVVKPREIVRSRVVTGPKRVPIIPAGILSHRPLAKSQLIPFAGLGTRGG